MPTKRTRRVRQSQSIESWKIEFLLTGRVKRLDGTDSSKPYLWLEEYRGPFCFHWKALWHELKAELLSAWLKEHPGTLPWAMEQEAMEPGAQHG